MAKRKRLEVPAETISAGLETNSGFSAPRARMPIAEVAGEVAGRAALEEVAREMTVAEEEGRVVKKLPLDAVEVDHLTRDRMVFDEDDMTALIESLSVRGQQTPIEVVALETGGYGLISGYRRVEALRYLKRTHVLALVRRPETSQQAYQAMVEENEIRSNISFYERAQVAVAAARQGVYPDVSAAIKGLFSHAPKSKRSKIAKFVTLYETIGPVLQFPAAVPEHLGLKLAQAIEADERLADRLGAELVKEAPEDAAGERKILEDALRKSGASAPSRCDEIAPGLYVETTRGRVAVSGALVDEGFVARLKAWLRTQG